MKEDSRLGGTCNQIHTPTRTVKQNIEPLEIECPVSTRIPETSKALDC
jgi:hypothetical protein